MTPYGRIPTMRELIAEYGVHLGTSEQCSCCGKYMLYRIPTGLGSEHFVVCNYCDTER